MNVPAEDAPREPYIPTTTHAEWGAGRPRLLVSGQEHFEFLVETDRVTIGSGEGADVRVAGIEPIHAEIRHDSEDEYLLVLNGPAETSAAATPRSTLDGIDAELLRTGAQFVLGPWTFVFARDEYADHGRPFGGREGGENSYQLTQRPRPDYSDHREEAPR